MRLRLFALALSMLLLAACKIEIPVSALLPPPRSGLWELEHKGDGSIYEIVLEFERGGNLRIWDAESVEDDTAYRDYEDTSDPKTHRWSHDTKKVEFLHCPPKSNFCGFYTMTLVSETQLEGYMVKLPPDGDKIHRVDYLATFKRSTLPTRKRPTPTPAATSAPTSSPSSSPQATATPGTNPSTAPDVIIL